MRSPFLFSTIQDYEINNNITKLARTQGKDQITNENLINTDGMFLTAQFKNISIYGYIYIRLQFLNDRRNCLEDRIIKLVNLILVKCNEFSMATDVIDYFIKSTE